MVFVLFILFLLCVLGSAYLFDSILRIFYEEHYSDWIEYGRPYGCFFWPEGFEFYSKKGLQRWWAVQRMYFSIAFKNPPWAISDTRALSLLSWYRRVNILSLFIWLGFVLAAVYQL